MNGRTRASASGVQPRSLRVLGGATALEAPRWPLHPSRPLWVELGVAGP